MTPFVLPKRWELRGGLKFSHLGLDADAPTPQAFNDPLREFLIAPLLQPVRAAEQPRANAMKPTQWRGVSAAGAPGATRNMLKRLEEFGLPTMQDSGDKAKDYTREELVLGEDGEGGYYSFTDAQEQSVRAAVRRLEREVPSARGVLVAKGGDGGTCDPAHENKIYDRFQRAFRFQRGDRVIWITHFQCRDGSAAIAYPSLAIFDSHAATAWLLTRGEAGDPDAGNAAHSWEGGCYLNIADCRFDAKIFGGRFLVLSSALSRAIEVYDLDRRRNVLKRYKLPRGDLLERVALSTDGKMVIQVNSDGSFAGFSSFAGFRAGDSKHLFDGRYIDDEVVVWAAPDGRFDATAEGAHFVSLRIPGQVGTHTFEQFSARMKTPGLVASVVSEQSFAPIKLMAPPSLSVLLQLVNGRVQGMAKAVAETSLDALLVYQDGLLTHRFDAAGAKRGLGARFRSAARGPLGLHGGGGQGRACQPSHGPGIATVGKASCTCARHRS